MAKGNLPKVFTVEDDEAKYFEIAEKLGFGQFNKQFAPALDLGSLTPEQETVLAEILKSKEGEK